MPLRPHVDPGEEAQGQQVGQPVQEDAQGPDHEDAREHHIDAGHLLGVEDPVAQPRGRRDHLGADDRPPAEPQAQAQPVEQARQALGEHDPLEDAQAGEPEAPAHLDQPGVHAPQPGHGAQEHRKEGGEHDERQFRGLAEAEPEDEHRDEGQRRDVAQEGQERVERRGQPRGEGGQDGQGQRQAHGEAEPLAHPEEGGRLNWQTAKRWRRFLHTFMPLWTRLDF